MDEALTELAEHVTAAFPDDVEQTEERCGELVVWCRRGTIVRLLTFLRDDSNCHFRQLLAVCGADYPEREERFEVVYLLLSPRHNQRIRVTRTDERRARNACASTCISRCSRYHYKKKTH